MNVSATSPSRKDDLRKLCGWLKLAADCKDEQRFLAELHMVFARGGTVHLKRPGAKRMHFAISFDGSEEPVKMPSKRLAAREGGGK